MKIRLLVAVLATLLAAAPAAADVTPQRAFVVTQAQFNQMFPNRNSFYTYSGLTTAMDSFPAFATGSDTIRKQEAAAFLANVHHETGGLVHIVEQNQANYPHYCDRSQSYGCPAGQSAYYGRGPIQLSWNFNYKAAGDHLGINLLNDPWQVQNNAAVSWKTALWYWMTQRGPGTMTPPQRDGKPTRFRRNHPQHQRFPGMQRRQPRPGHKPGEQLHPFRRHPRRPGRLEPALLKGRGRHRPPPHSVSASAVPSAGPGDGAGPTW